MARSSIKSYNKPFSGGKSRSRGRGWFERKIYVSSIGRKVAPKHRKVAINYYKSTGHYTPVSAGQVRSKMAGRSKRSQLMDRGKQSRRVGSIGNPIDRSQWAKDPGRMDLRGVDTKVKPKPAIKPKKEVKKEPVKPKEEPVEPVVKTKLVIEPETELSALKKQEMKYYREEVSAKSDEAKMQAYEKRLAINKKIKRLTTPPRPKKPELEPWQKQLNHESKQITRIQKLDDRIYKQTSMDAELQVVKKEYDPKGDGGKDPVLFERQVERHRAKLKDDISSLKQDKKVSIADNKIKYAGDYMTYSHGLTEEEFKAIK